MHPDIWKIQIGQVSDFLCLDALSATAWLDIIMFDDDDVGGKPYDYYAEEMLVWIKTGFHGVSGRAESCPRAFWGAFLRPIAL